MASKNDLQREFLLMFVGDVMNDPEKYSLDDLWRAFLVGVINGDIDLGGGGGGDVASVNGQTGTVVLHADDINLSDESTDLESAISDLNQNKIGSSNGSVEDFQRYSSVEDFPSVGVDGVVYIAPAV